MYLENFILGIYHLLAEVIFNCERGSSDTGNVNIFTSSEIASSKLVPCKIAQKELHPPAFYALPSEKPSYQNTIH